MANDQHQLEVKLASIRAGLMELYGKSESFLYEFAVAVENELTDMEVSQQEAFITIAKSQGYMPSIRFEGTLFEHSEDGESF